MANVRDSDTSLWLHNKLGTSNDSWTGGSICTQLNAEVLKNIKDCFPDLQTQVKLKLLLSFFHIPRRNVEEWRNELEEIIEVAGVDSELWVSMLAEVMKTLPETGSLNTKVSEFDETRPIFSDMINELKKLVNKHSDLGLLPLECHYLNKAALISVVGQQPSPVKHFTLKRKPKSVALRAELLAKSVDAQANLKKSVAPTVPVRSRGMPRKMTDTTPLKGLPSRWAPRAGGGGSALARGTPPTPARPLARPQGIKLLDITEQPATQQQIRKRKKLEMEEQQQAQSASKKAAVASAGVVEGAPPSTSPPPSALPEYARALPTYAMPSAPPTLTSIASTATLTPTTPTPAAATDDADEQDNPAVSSTPVTPTTLSSPPPLTVPTTPSKPPALIPVSTPAIVTPKTPRNPLTPTPLPNVKTPAQESNPNPAVAQITTSNLTLNRPILLQPTTGSKPIILGQQQKLLITGQPGQKPLLVTAGPNGTLYCGQNTLKTSSGVPVILSNSVLQHATQNQGQTILQQGPGGKVVLTSVKNMPGLIQQSQGNQGVILQNLNPQNVVLTQKVVQQPQDKLPQSIQTVNQPQLGQQQLGQTQQTQQQVVQTQEQNVQTRVLHSGVQSDVGQSNTIQGQNTPSTQQPAIIARPGLSLTKEQMLEAQHMFRNANRVTRPEKALILGFMAGSRNNPCPNLGNIVTIKLSENLENVMQQDDTYLTMIAEMHFQMNYNNGRWTRLMKYRSIEGMSPQKIPPGSTITYSSNQTAIVTIAGQSVAS